MPRWLIKRTIAAPLHEVFTTVADPTNFAKAVPEIVRIEFLSDQTIGVGTRFRETRRMGGKVVANDLEVTELVPDSRVRMLADTHGTVWDSIFSVTPDGTSTVLELSMVTRTNRLSAKVMNVLIHPMVRRAVSRNLDQVKSFCERDTAYPNQG